MRKPKTAWEVACMVLDQGISQKGICIMGLIGESPYISSPEIQQSTGWSRNTVNTQIRALMKNQLIGHRVYKGVNLYKLADDRFSPFFRYLRRAIQVIPMCQKTHIQVMRAIEEDHHRLVYEIAQELGLAESTVKNALQDIFKGRVLAKRDRDKGYIFLPLLAVLTSVSK